MLTVSLRIYRLGEHCKIMWNTVLASQTTYTHTYINTPLIQSSEAHFLCCSYRLILWLQYWAPMHRPRKQELSLACACSITITHTSADYESEPNEPQQRSEVATHRGRPQNPPITQFFIKAIFQKAERGERTHSSSKPHSGKQLRINRDTVKGMQSHPWTNLKTNSVRFLNNAQQRNKISEDCLAYEES